MKREIITSEAIKGELYFGVEIEALLRAYSLTGFLTELHQLYGDLVTGKRDGTVEGNVEKWMGEKGNVIATELVVSPMTLECYQNRKWSAIFDKVLKPESSYTCQLGGHIHMSLNSFVNRLHLYKYMKFIRTNIEYIKFIGERDFSRNNYCKAHSNNGKVVQQVKHWSTNGDRYEMLNVTHFDTLENRFFVSPFTREHLLKNLEWCQALWAFTKTASLHFTVEDFHAWVHKHDKEYPSLIKFIKDCGTFTVNEEVVRYYDDDEDEDEEHTCSSCGDDITYYDDVIWVDGEAYCCDCAFFCERCQEYRTGDSYTADGECWCEVCYNRYALVCGRCGEAEPSNNTTIEYVTSQNRNLCESCRDDLNIEWCDCCDEYTEHTDSSCDVCSDRGENEERFETPPTSCEPIGVTMFTSSVSNYNMEV